MAGDETSSGAGGLEPLAEGHRVLRMVRGGHWAWLLVPPWGGAVAYIDSLGRTEAFMSLDEVERELRGQGFVSFGELS